MTEDSLWPKVEALLGEVERPSRYIDHEHNARRPQTATGGLPQAQSGLRPPDGQAQAGYRAVLLYPDSYELGQSNQAIGILYQIINQLPGCLAERAYLPWVDMIAAMRRQRIPLFSLESCSPVAGFDLFGITLPHELAATNILEALDLAGIPLHGWERGEDDPIVLGGGPGAFNPEPLSAFFDAIVVGEGEEAITEVIAAHRRSLAEGCGRSQTLLALAGIPGVYVPSLYQLQPDGSLVPAAPDDVAPLIRKRVLSGFAETGILTDPIVPFAEVAHDRLTVEVLRGCSRGCRFCQAGMIYRPVRERSADMIVAAVSSGLQCTGYDEVSLTSLSTTDHSEIEQILRRLNHLLSGSGISISIPSQRLDAFGVAMAALVASEKKTGLTLAPEAGSQRLRDAINKNVTEQDLLGAITQAYAQGWRRCKLYFMIGLPGESDEDVVGIIELANRAYAAAKEAVPDKDRQKVRISLSVAVFVPKPHTPFQWQGQIALAEIERRVQLLRSSGLHKGIDLHWHDPTTSRLEAALSRAGREAGQLIERAWRGGAAFDAWSERFQPEVWQQAAADCGLSIDVMAERDFGLDEVLPWEHIDSGVSKGFLQREYQLSLSGKTSEDCSFSGCIDCGVCDGLDARIDLAGERHE